MNLLKASKKKSKTQKLSQSELQALDVQWTNTDYFGWETENPNQRRLIAYNREDSDGEVVNPSSESEDSELDDNGL